MISGVTYLTVRLNQIHSISPIHQVHRREKYLNVLQIKFDIYWPLIYWNQWASPVTHQGLVCTSLLFLPAFLFCLFVLFLFFLSFLGTFLVVRHWSCLLWAWVSSWTLLVLSLGCFGCHFCVTFCSRPLFSYRSSWACVVFFVVWFVGGWPGGLPLLLGLFVRASVGPLSLCVAFLGFLLLLSSILVLLLFVCPFLLPFCFALRIFCGF